MNAKHTAGPWEVGHSIGAGLGVWPVGDIDLPVARITLDRDEARANARLVAAAPELLAACKSLLEEIIVSIPGRAANPLIRMLETAIAKAEADE